MPSGGVFRQFDNAKNSDWPDSLHFLNNRLIVFTAFSAFRFDCGYVGDDVECSKAQLRVKTVNSDDANFGHQDIWNPKSRKNLLVLFDDTI